MASSSVLVLAVRIAFKVQGERLDRSNGLTFRTGYTDPESPVFRILMLN